MSNVAQLRSGGKIAGIVPTTIEEVFRLATAIAKSGLAPRGMDTPEKLTVAIMFGLEIGVPPMMAVNKIAVVNGRPTLWGDAIPALLLANGFRLRERFENEGDQRVACCVVVRPDGEQIERRFSVADARKAGLWGKAGPWAQYPDRMLQMRARGLASRDGAADVLSGLYLREEIEEDTAKMRDVTPAASPAARVAPPADEIPEVPDMEPDMPAAQATGEAAQQPDKEPDIADAAGFLRKLRDDLDGIADEAIRAEIWDSNLDIIERLNDADRRIAEAIMEGRR